MSISIKQISGIPIDAFNRVAASLPTTVVQIKQSSPLMFDLISEGEVSGSGTSSNYTTIDDGCTDLTVGSVIGVRRLRSRLPSFYQNGKSHLVFLTFNLLTLGQANVKKEVGYRDDFDGIILEQDGTTLGLRLISSTGASDYKPRSEWDNPLDNPENDGYIDFTKAPILYIRFEYLAEGVVEVGFVINKKFYIAHTFNKANTLTNPYWRTPNLFLHYQIERTLDGGTLETLKTVCGCTISEGSLDIQKYPIIIDSATDKNIGNLGEIRPLILFRLNPTYINSRVSIKEFLASIDSNTTFIVKIIRNPDLGGFTPTWVNVANRSVQYQLLDTETITIPNTVLNTSEVFLTSYGNQQSDIASQSLNEHYYLTVQYDNTPDIFALTITTKNSNETSNYRFIHLLQEV